MDNIDSSNLFDISRFENLWNYLYDSKVIWLIFENNDEHSIKFISNNINLMGYSITPSEFSNISLKSMIHPDDLNRFYAKIDNFKNEKVDNFIIEFRIIDGFGKIFWAEARIATVYKGKEIIEYQSAIFDITDRKNDQILKEVAYKISDAINSTPNLDILLNNIKSILHDVIDTTNFFIALYNVENDTLTLPFFADEVDKFTEFPARKTLTSYIIRNDISMLANEETLNQLEREGEIELVGSPSKIWMGVPLKIGKDIIGAIVTQSYEDEFLYNEFHLEVMKFVSEQVAFAIQRKQSDDTIRLNEEKYRLIIENSPLGILHFDSKGVVTACNLAHSIIIGTEIEKLIGFNMIETLEEDFIKEIIKKAINGIPSGYEGSYTSTTGHRKTIIKADTVPIFNDNNEVIGGISILEDITERKVAEEGLKHSQEQLSSIFNNAIAGISILDTEGKYRYYNNHFANMLGYKVEEMINFGFLDITHPDDLEISINGFNDIVKNEQKSIRLEKRYVRKDGSIFWGDLSVSASSKNDNTIDSITIIIADITSKKFAEKKILVINEQLKEINATKDKFFSIISHDLRNNLGSFRNVTKLLLDSFEYFSKEEMMESLSLISSTSQRVYTLLENLLEWSRSQTGRIPFNPEVFNLYLPVNNIVELLKANAKVKSINLVSEVSEFCYVYADVNMINTVLRNLVTNAIKFTPENGTILIKVQHNIDAVIVTVEDTGVGISPENLSKLFRIDENITTIGTANEQGSGLGLILCREFIEKNSGTIWVKSEFGKGSKFKFALPFEEIE